MSSNVVQLSGKHVEQRREMKYMAETEQKLMKLGSSHYLIPLSILFQNLMVTAREHIDRHAMWWTYGDFGWEIEHNSTGAPTVVFDVSTGYYKDHPDEGKLFRGKMGYSWSEYNVITEEQQTKNMSDLMTYIDEIGRPSDDIDFEMFTFFLGLAKGMGYRHHTVWRRDGEDFILTIRKADVILHLSFEYAAYVKRQNKIDEEDAKSH